MRGCQILRSHEEIEVSEWSQREVAVAADGQEGPLVRHRGHAVPGEEIEEPNQLAGQAQVATRIGLDTSAQRGAHRSGDGAVAGRPEVVMDQREHPVGASCVEQPGPVQVIPCQFPDLVRGPPVQ